jgi:hypothetical protein
VCAVLLVGCSGHSRHVTRIHSLAQLDAAVRGLSTSRAAMLAGIEAVQSGAQALDATDQICAKGQGTAARTSQRAGAGDVAQAGTAVGQLPHLVATYRASLTALDKAKSLVSGAPLTALQAVVRDGGSEADAVTQFSGTAASAWQQYKVLDHEERLWIHRAVTPWYRTQKEAANAYAVLVGPYRRLLEVARTQLAAASREVMAPTSAQAATLAAADRALASLRT